MKIGILTLYYKNYNYGGLLQSYALQNILKRYNSACEQICVDIQYSHIEQDKNRSFWYWLRKFPWRVLDAIKRMNIVKRIVETRMSERETAFRSFEVQIPHSKIIYNKENYRALSDQYDVIVVGSDQVWANWLPDRVFQIYTAEGGFGNSRLVSYAASISSQKISDIHREMLQKNLKGFSHISVREETAKAQLEELLPEKEIKVVCDPVLLLSREDWDQVAKTPDIQGKYIVCYFLGQVKWHRDFAKAVANQKQIPILYFPYIKSGKISFQELTWGDIRNYDADPGEFIGLIKNAEMIITDSFHAMVFSVIYHKEFYVLLRNSKENQNSMNDRIFDFVKRFGLEKQLVQEEAQRKELRELNSIIDYQKVERQMSEQKIEAINYIENMLI